MATSINNMDLQRTQNFNQAFDCHCLQTALAWSISRTTKEVLELLKAGNLRFTQGSHTGHKQNAHRRIHTTEAGQKPFAAILACSDSRVPVEMLFDCGIGDIFVARVAGNVAGVDQLESLEYAVAYLGVPLVVVLGHSKCGAVTAVVKGDDMQGHIKSLAKQIAPVVKKSRRIYPDVEMDELLDHCIRANVRPSRIILRPEVCPYKKP
jgi:carbonic anhydrase